MKVKLKTKKIKILNGLDLYLVMQRVLMREEKIDRDREHFWVVSLASNNTLLNIELISMGSKKFTVVEPMEVFSVALQKRSVSIILVHNHPSGGLQPSINDVDLTDRLHQAGNFLEVPVLDHLIITEKGFLSFAESGMLKEIAKSKKYVLPYKEQERLLKAAKEIGKKEGLKAGQAKGLKAGEARGRMAVAQVLKSKGIKAKVIAEATGLKLAEVRKLKG